MTLRETQSLSSTLQKRRSQETSLLYIVDGTPYSLQEFDNKNFSLDSAASVKIETDPKLISKLTSDKRIKKIVLVTSK